MIDLSHIPKPEHKLVFGENTVGNLILPADPTFKQLSELDESNVWFLNVINCTNDRWDDLPESALTKFRLTVAYQTAMDALVPDIFKPLSNIVTDPWLQYLYSRISTMEYTHELSYSSGISQAFGAKALDFFNVIYTDNHIAARVEDELLATNELIKASHNWSNTEHNRKTLLTALVVTFALEGIKFPFSFFTTWTLNRAYNQCIQGFSQLLLLIAWDEMTVHTATGSNFINKLRKDPNFRNEFKSDWFNDMAYNHFDTVYRKELQWIDYLLQSGEEPGFNKEICTHFIQYWTDKRLREINLKPKFNVKKNDIEIWFDEYRNIKHKQSALQEISNNNYQLGQLINDLHKFDEKHTQEFNNEQS